MRIAFASDHRGAQIRSQLIEHIQKRGHEVLDFSSGDEPAADYPDLASGASRAVVENEADRAVLMCGTGIGMSIAANKIAGIRCAVCTDEFGARMARSHNDANALALRATDMDPMTNLALIDIFLETPFEGGRHQVRVDKVRDLERS
jgi:ribose 5-phosphate isomerase B